MMKFNSLTDRTKRALLAQGVKTDEELLRAVALDCRRFGLLPGIGKMAREEIERLYGVKVDISITKTLTVKQQAKADEAIRLLKQCGYKVARED